MRRLLFINDSECLKSKIRKNKRSTAAQPVLTSSNPLNRDTINQPTTMTTRLGGKPELHQDSPNTATTNRHHHHHGNESITEEPLLVPVLDANSCAQEVVYQAPSSNNNNNNNNNNTIQERPIAGMAIHNHDSSSQSSSSLQESLSPRKRRALQQTQTTSGTTTKADNNNNNFELIQEWDVVLGDTSAREGRTTAATKVLRDIKLEFKDKYFGKKRGTWIDKAMGQLEMRVAQQWGQFGKVLIKCTAKNQNRVQGVQRYGYAGDAEPSFGQTKNVKEALTKFFHSRDAPNLAREVAGYQKKLLALKLENHRPPTVLMQHFEERVLFFARQLELADQEDDASAQKFLEDLAPINTLKSQWKILQEHKQAQPLKPGECDRKLPPASAREQKNENVVPSRTLTEELQYYRQQLKGLEQLYGSNDPLLEGFVRRLAFFEEQSDKAHRDDFAKELLKRSKPAQLLRTEWKTLQKVLGEKTQPDDKPPALGLDPGAEDAFPKSISIRESDSPRGVCDDSIDLNFLAGLSDGPGNNSLFSREDIVMSEMDAFPYLGQGLDSLGSKDGIALSDPDAILRMGLGLDSSEDMTMPASLGSFLLGGSDSDTRLDRGMAKRAAVSRRTARARRTSHDESSTSVDPPGYFADSEEEYNRDRSAGAATSAQPTTALAPLPSGERVVSLSVGAGANPIPTIDAIPSVPGVPVAAHVPAVLNPYMSYAVFAPQPPILTEEADKLMMPTLASLSHVNDLLQLMRLIRARPMDMPSDAVETIVEDGKNDGDTDKNDDGTDKNDDDLKLDVEFPVNADDEKQQESDPSQTDASCGVEGPITQASLAGEGDVPSDSVVSPRQYLGTSTDEKASPRLQRIASRGALRLQRSSHEVAENGKENEKRVMWNLPDVAIERGQNSHSSNSSTENGLSLQPGAMAISGVGSDLSEGEIEADITTGESFLKDGSYAYSYAVPRLQRWPSCDSEDNDITTNRTRAGRNSDLIDGTNGLPVLVATAVQPTELVYGELIDDTATPTCRRRKLPRPWRAFGILVRAASKLRGPFRLRRSRSRRHLNEDHSHASTKTTSSRVRRGHPRVGLWQDESRICNVIDDLARDLPTTEYVC